MPFDRFFGRTMPRQVDIPQACRRPGDGVPGLGDIFPDFTRDSTAGRLSFHAWAEGSWTCLFALPHVFSPVCATDIADLAFLHPDLERLGVRPLGLTRALPVETEAWVREIGALFGLPVRFPVCSDPDATLLRAAGMIDPAVRAAQPVRRTFILDPALRIRRILDLPAGVGRSGDALLRILQALQTADARGGRTPAGWEDRDPVLPPPAAGQSARQDGRHGRRIPDDLAISLRDA
jgi:thioredoxin-dependent peroxiredoxin